MANETIHIRLDYIELLSDAGGIVRSSSKLVTFIYENILGYTIIIFQLV